MWEAAYSDAKADLLQLLWFIRATEVLLPEHMTHTIIHKSELGVRHGKEMRE
jgi:hypothetical protein